MGRRQMLGCLAAATMWPAAAQTKGGYMMFQEVLERSMQEKKGVTLFVKGQTVAGVVLKIGTDAVEMRSQMYSKIVVKLESIDAAALS